MKNQSSRAAYLKRRYNLTLAEYDQILKEQGGVCAGCERRPSDFKVNLHVDHDHSGRRLLRGLLCWQCNRMLPNRRGLIFIFENLLAYLAKPPAIRAIGEREFKPIKRRKRK